MQINIKILLFYLFLKSGESSDCYWNADCKYKYFSSKTPYEFARGDLRDSIVKQQGCEPISVWTIMRHGKRNPGIKYAQYIKDILKYKGHIISSYEIGNSSLCAQDIDNLRNSKIDKSFFGEPNEISNEGYQELLGIGSRLKEALPVLLNRLEGENYLFRPAYGRRMYESAKAFIEGLNYDKLNITDGDNDYSITAPHTTCGKYQVEIIRNTNIFHAVTEYLNAKDYLEMKNRVENRLGINFTLTDHQVTALYDICRYQYEGISNKPSPWCALLSTEDLQVLEYIGDLNHYYRNGYGVSKYSEVLGQFPLADLLKHFREARNGIGKKIVSHFTHATLMDMILVVLNLYKDTNPLTGAHRDWNRKWRSTFLSTFASNFIAVLNRCNKLSGNDSDYNVAFYWNEEPLLELCNRGVCSWQEFEDNFKPFLYATTDISLSEARITNPESVGLNIVTADILVWAVGDKAHTLLLGQISHD